MQEQLILLLTPRPELTMQDPGAVADRMVASLPRIHDFDQLGPFYDTAGLTKWLGVTRQALMARVKFGSLLGCQTQDGDWVYPAWQMFEDGRVVPHIADVVKILKPSAARTWTDWTPPPGCGMDVTRNLCSRPRNAAWAQ